MKSLYPRSHDVQAEVTWSGTRGTIKGQKNLEVIFDRPAIFGGKGEFFCPDELFIGALASCFINTFLSLSSRFDSILAVASISLRASAELILEDTYHFRKLSIKGKMTFNFAEMPLLRRLIELSKKNCHLFACLNQDIKTTITVDIEITNSGSGKPSRENIVLN